MGNAATGRPAIPRGSVHPHGCGERAAQSLDQPHEGGSSPRLWGTRSRPSGKPTPQRFIPTAVGNAFDIMLITNQIPVHPHGCGERSVAGYFRSFKAGSSPRLWGTLQHRQTIGNQCRFIPTAVGNAPHGGRAGQRQPVHPHGCGERLNPSFKLPTDTGSSPRLWGTQVVDTSRY